LLSCAFSSATSNSLCLLTCWQVCFRPLFSVVSSTTRLSRCRFSVILFWYILWGFWTPCGVVFVSQLCLTKGISLKSRLPCLKLCLDCQCRHCAHCQSCKWRRWREPGAAGKETCCHCHAQRMRYTGPHLAPLTLTARALQASVAPCILP